MTEQSHEHDEACMEIIKSKCYYEVLKIDKSSNQDEIRRAYKKVSVIINKQYSLLLNFILIKINQDIQLTLSKK